MDEFVIDTFASCVLKEIGNGHALEFVASFYDLGVTEKSSDADILKAAKDYKVCSEY